jgi:hypothetical protein
MLCDDDMREAKSALSPHQQLSRNGRSRIGKLKELQTGLCHQAYVGEATIGALSGSRDHVTLNFQPELLATKSKAGKGSSKSFR